MKEVQMSQKAAVSVESLSGAGSILDPRFGRAGGFVIFDVGSGAVVEEVENSGQEQAHGAGTGAAAMMQAHGVFAVVSGRFGPKAYRALEALGIEMYAAAQIGRAHV